ncbi:formylmethanofuran dehydrogenase subunit B [Adhaeretor mobilis]|uniref:Uncharacterized protein n=1 Tax=Adhaeretor mobilis TaxID=1930276 RepID=A0A517MPQ8_9BACT|nr:formylmethanofuran dehydrogenase subunit B [Adhaeretor mobilis]QDS96852.1 hypothetical protein HG15A2_01100 [Adhaeretor mobilis]
MTKTHHDVACTVCGCVCDDISLEVRDNQIVSHKNLCTLGEPAFLELTDAASLVSHKKQLPAQTLGLEEKLQCAAEILANSRAPLVYGMSRSSTPGHRAAVRLADKLGAVIDTTASTCHAASIMALQQVGESTASLGEVRHRSDLVIYWGSNPLVSHPRHIERFVDAPGQFIPGGRKDRKLIVVDTEKTKTAELADIFIQVEPGGDFELLCALRMLTQGKPLGVGGPIHTNQPSTSVGGSIGGVELEQIEHLAKLLRTCHYGAVFFGFGITHTSVPHATIEALLQLVTELNDHTRFIARRMRIPGDVSGADSVLTWQTGFPFGVNLARGYPRYNPGEYTAGSLLERKEVDAVVIVGSEGVAKLSPSEQEYLKTVPTIVLDYPGRECSFQPTVQFTTGVYGLHYEGTAYRMDEVPIPLRAVLQSDLPSDEQVLQGILERVLN